MASNEKLTIETPEHTALDFPLAGIGSRFLALAIDTLLQIGAIAVLGIIAAIIASAGILKAMGKQWGIALLILSYFVIEVGYFAFFESIWNGQTPGKRWTHLRVIKDSGQPIGVQDAVLRNLVRVVDVLPSLYATGVVTILIGSQNKRIGDYAAGTVVVHEKPLQGARTWSLPATQPVAMSQIPVITLEELQLVEVFVARRESFAPEVRSSMAREIADRLGQHWSVPPDARPDSEKFLEVLAEQCRNTARFR